MNMNRRRFLIGAGLIAAPTVLRLPLDFTPRGIIVPPSEIIIPSQHILLPEVIPLGSVITIVNTGPDAISVGNSTREVILPRRSYTTMVKVGGNEFVEERGSLSKPVSQLGAIYVIG